MFYILCYKENISIDWGSVNQTAIKHDKNLEKSDTNDETQYL